MQDKEKLLTVGCFISFRSFFYAIRESAKGIKKDIGKKFN